MTVSRADGLRRPAGLLLAGAVACALPAIVLPGGAGAQPIQLIRPAQPVERAPAPQSQPGSQSGPGSAPAEPAAPAAPLPADAVTPGKALPMRPLDKSAIMVNSLEAVDPDAIGTIGEAEGGFPVGIWQGTDWAFVRSMMPRLPDRTASPTIRALTVRLLLSRASVPAGKPPGESFVSLRVERLLAMGDLGDALALLRMVPEGSRGADFARTEIEAMFYDNRVSEACGKVRASVGQYDGDYWKQAQAFCLALAGESARASLIADLLRERSRGTDPAFFTAIEALGGMKPPAAVTPKQPSGLMFALLRAAKIRLADDAAGAERPIALRSIAMSPNADLKVRLSAAEKAFSAGALDADEMIRFYLGIPFSDEELANPISRAESDWGPRGRALLIRAAAAQKNPLAKAEALRRAWAIAREKGEYPLVARISVPEVAAIPPAPELTWFAADAARVLFAAGRTDEAMRWYGIVSADRDRVDEARSAEADLWAVARLAGGGESGPVSPARLKAWFDEQKRAAPETAYRRALALFAMLEATGHELSPDLWRALLEGPVVSNEPGLNVAWEKNLESAVADGRTGEAAMLIAIGAAATGDEAYPSLPAARRAIAALRALGLEADGRRLAVETAMAAGL